MKKLRTIQTIADAGIVAVLRGDSPAQAVKMAEGALEGGIRIIEITMTVPYALEAIKELSKRYAGSPDIVIGAGTVLDPETARAAILDGAEFVVGPSLHEETVVLCNRYRIPVMPGVMTIADIQRALELGVDIVKLFPGNLYSPDMIRAVRGPLPQANLMPTGGVTLDNLAEWFEAGAVAVGIGSDLTREAVKTGEWHRVRTKAEQYVEKLAEARARSRAAWERG
ncbi:bifunctional 2-keto-4-hydroxyglutarate aldolase/2-keto-3-deoxy-6-phosphogluconate aldolase [Paenibacillus thermotolerans]|uniref:bifunctional 2-keto-4-hydroxyglutarate aldolase/2-keto-3-deoxy-6-phosphogluconate aldolase n=1 Tax=Paenibacillus thermotolerans TaxID=3027807 RepID=UPI002368B6A9|nr:MULTISPECIES: bifunctional 2-keto-4-hydroxyglutarate aldolase/2-keto-3-deoxy-6-phosphogluconate aldolase [unclassified Paenibacillus]